MKEMQKKQLLEKKISEKKGIDWKKIMFIFLFVFFILWLILQKWACTTSITTASVSESDNNQINTVVIDNKKMEHDKLKKLQEVNKNTNIQSSKDTIEIISKLDTTDQPNMRVVITEKKEKNKSDDHLIQAESLDQLKNPTLISSEDKKIF